MESRGWHLAFLCVGILTFLSRCTQGQATGDCPADGRTWVPFGKSCYHFVHGEEDIPKSYTIERAKEICSGFSTSLLTVRSAEENSFIADYSSKVWKGSINIWLGMYYDSDVDAFKWNDNSPLTFNKWEEGDEEDPEQPLIDTCVILHVASEMWENVSCSENPENGVVCETLQKTVVPVNKNGSPVLSALVIVSVILILGISAFVWFIQQRSNSGSTLLPSFEYHPPFGAPSADQTCLVEAEEIEETS
ncbi:CD302 antigen [Astyanax mexicanus]|uniref:CD302 antigen n=1 Tax=Astyanax mexicanus TaxID=7994 RepID=A0A8T2LIB1_ASTMX|nr:CD302 antigen [Astyanax mexicanus]